MEEFISVLGNKIKKEVIKTLTEFKKIVDRYTDYCKKGTKNYKNKPIKIDSLIAKIKTNPETVNIRLNDIEE